MFGTIEDLANAGSLNDQVHSISPTLFFNPGGNDNQGEKNEAKAGEDEKAAGPPATELALNVCVQFGLTDATSDTALNKALSGSERAGSIAQHPCRGDKWNRSAS